MTDEELKAGAIATWKKLIEGAENGTIKVIKVTGSRPVVTLPSYGGFQRFEPGRVETWHFEVERQ